MATAQVRADIEKGKVIENTIKRAVKAACATGRELGFTEEQIRALGDGIKVICDKYAAEQVRPKINRKGNLNWSKEQVDAMRALRRDMETRLRVDLARSGANQKIMDVVRESCIQSFHAATSLGEERPHEAKTPLQQAYSRKSRVIDIRAAWYVR